MPLDPERVPVVLASGQAESRDNALGPLELAELAAAEALGEVAGLGDAIERLSVVNILSRRAGATPATDVAKRLGLAPARLETTSVGGNTPQLLVNRAAADIVAGRLQATLVVGAEAVRSGRLKAAGEAPAAIEVEQLEPDPVLGSYRQDLSDPERASGLFVPVQIYPLFESVLATRAGRSPAEQRAFLGELLAPFTAVAARHPHAWFPIERTPDEIAVPSPDNRLVAEPYTKLMAAFLGGAQGAAVVVTSLAVARRLKAEDRVVFVRSGASLDDVWYPLARPDLGRSPAIAAAGRAVLAGAGVTLDEVDLFDVYSCFPSAVELGAAALGLALDDERGLTVTGGLPYFGGPGNNYATHAIATLTDLLRARGEGTGLVTALGWYATKHSLGVYATEPGDHGFVGSDLAAEQARIDAGAREIVPLDVAVAAPATVEASTAFYDREGHVAGAPIYATLDDGRRVAAAAAGVDEAAATAGRFLVGESVEVAQAGDGTVASYRLAARRGRRAPTENKGARTDE